MCKIWTMGELLVEIMRPHAGLSLAEGGLRRGHRTLRPPEGLNSRGGVGVPTGRSQAALLTWGDCRRSERIRAEPKWENPG